MKVLHLITGLKAGGAENMVYEICKRATRVEDMMVEVVSLTPHNETGWKFQRSGVPVFLHPKNVRWIGSLTLVIKALQRVIRSKPDVIHAHLFHACVVACIARLFLPGSRVAFSLHNSRLVGFTRRLLIFLTRPFRTIDILLPGTENKWYFKATNRVIPNGVDVEHYRRAVRETDKFPVFTILFAGRLEPQKRPLMIPQLASQLKGLCEFRIVVAGDGRLRKPLLEEIRRGGLTGLIELTGYQHDLSGLLARSHCLILPSDYEGMPLILLEAGSAGLPIVATPEANQAGILNNESGYVVPRELFYKPILEIISCPHDATKKAATLQKIITERFDVRKSVDAHIDLYHVGTKVAGKLM